MKNNLTLGSLFDGSGGFPLGGLISGITPVWSSEVEPFAVRVITKRMPDIKHYGDVSKIDGGEIPPVDIITFGSPCQDMSIAGRREGLNGSRSNLFYEAVRIVKEMRCKTDGKYPRFVVWENVTGAFSSNKGEDFRQVLESICRVKDSHASIPRFEKWKNAGEILGDDYSVAWRVFDAQYWGVPQRRKRIYLVADFDGGCAGKILFKSEGLSGYTPQSFRSWQETAGCTGEGTAETGTVCLNDQGGNRMDVTEDKTCTLRAKANHPPLVFENHSQDTRYRQLDEVAPTVLSTYGTGGNNQPFVLEEPKCFDVRFTSEGTKNARQNCYETDTSRTIDTGGNTPDSNQGGVAVVAAYGICSKDSNSMKSNNPSSGFYKAETSRTLDANGGNPSCNQGGIAVIEGNGTRPSHKGDGYKESDVMYTLNATEQHAVAFSQDTYSTYHENEKCGALRASGGMYGGGSETLVYSTSKSSYHTIAEKELANTLVASDYKDPPIINDSVPKYIVRRLTPQECARLQGFPDWWCSDLETENPTDEDMKFWRAVFDDYARINGRKLRSDNQIRKWLQSPHTDSAEYKLWGNGVALPCVCFVLAGIVYYAQNENE